MPEFTAVVSVTASSPGTALCIQGERSCTELNAFLRMRTDFEAHRFMHVEFGLIEVRSRRQWPIIINTFRSIPQAIDVNVLKAAGEMNSHFSAGLDLFRIQRHQPEHADTHWI